MGECNKNCSHGRGTHKCPDGILSLPDGIYDGSTCLYEDIEKHTNCTVIVSKCKNCGDVTISWCRTEVTEDFLLAPDDSDA